MPTLHGCGRAFIQQSSLHFPSFLSMRTGSAPSTLLGRPVQCRGLMSRLFRIPKWQSSEADFGLLLSKWPLAIGKSQEWRPSLHLSLLPFATAWIARTRLASSLLGPTRALRVRQHCLYRFHFVASRIFMRTISNDQTVIELGCACSSERVLGQGFSG
jgi:hypothetical protein